jgi:hypothetical protein
VSQIKNNIADNQLLRSKSCQTQEEIMSFKDNSRVLQFVLYNLIISRKELLPQLPNIYQQVLPISPSKKPLKMQSGVKFTAVFTAV